MNDSFVNIHELTANKLRSKKDTLLQTLIKDKMKEIQKT